MSTDSALRELTVEETGPVLDPSGFGFTTTDELPPLDESVGQPRAVRAFDLGLGVRRPGYHIYLSGLSGTGKTWLAELYAQAVGAERLLVPVAPNWNTNEDLLGYFNPMDNQ